VAKENKFRKLVIEQCIEELHGSTLHKMEEIIFYWFHQGSTYMILDALVKQIKECKDDDKLIDLYKEIMDCTDRKVV